MFFTLRTRSGAVVTQRKQLHVYCMGQLGHGYAISVGGVWVCARTCVHAHGLKEQGKDKGHLLWPCFCFCFFLVISDPLWSPGGSALPLVSSQSMGRPGKVWLLGSSNMRLFPSWLPSLAQLFLGMGLCLSPRAACLPGLGTAYLHSASWLGIVGFSPVGREHQTWERSNPRYQCWKALEMFKCY